MKDERSDKQKLIDICFQIAHAMHTYRGNFEHYNTEQVMEWVALQLKECGYPTTPCGSSWGVLVEKKGA